MTSTDNSDQADDTVRLVTAWITFIDPYGNYITTNAPELFNDSVKLDRIATPDEIYAGMKIGIRDIEIQMITANVVQASATRKQAEDA